MLRIDRGGEYRGEIYISCSAHPTKGRNNGQGRGEIFDGDTIEELDSFLAAHRECGLRL